MKFSFPINEADGNGSVTVDVVETNSNCARTNKRKLKQYLTARGVPQKLHKKCLREMGFTGKRLTNVSDTAERFTSLS